VSYEYHSKKADYFFHHGNYPEMLYHLSEKVKLEPKDVETWSDLAYYYWSMSVDNKKRRDEFKTKALSYLERGLDKNPESSFMWDELGRFYLYNDKKYEKAIGYFEQALLRKDCNNITYHLLALCYEKVYRNNDAIKILKECMSKFPNDMRAKSKLESLNNSESKKNKLNGA